MKKPLLLKSSPRLRIEFSKGCRRSVFVRQTTHSLLPRPANEKISRCNSISPFRSPLRKSARFSSTRGGSIWRRRGRGSPRTILGSKVQTRTKDDAHWRSICVLTRSVAVSQLQLEEGRKVNEDGRCEMNRANGQTWQT